MVPNARFTELLADIEPSSTTKSAASSAHSAVRAHLKTHPDFKEVWVGDFLAGSYARNTAIRPKKSEGGYERPDIDIIVVTDFSTEDEPDVVLRTVSKALKDSFTVERINKRSVRVVTTDADIDVVPVIPDGTIYQIPDREIEYWKATNPPGHTEWSRIQNEDFEGRFKPLVKLFKWWRRENKTGKRPKGFVLEVLASKHAPPGELHYGESFARMLEGIYSEYGALAAIDYMPYIEDPGLPGNNILSKVSLADWKNFIDRVRVHAGYARRAQDEDDVAEATRLWRKLFGNRFKATSTAAKAESLAGYANAPAIGVSGQYIFPDQPAAPNKPRDFA